MAAPPPPPPTTGKGANVVSGKVNAYLGMTFYGSDAITPPLLTTSNVITYNGFSWTLSQGVTTGRFISGEPFIVIPAGGVTVQAMSFSDKRGTFSCPALVKGFTSAETQAANGDGFTFWINGFMKNPTPWYEQREFNWVGATYYNWNYDERAASGSIERNKPFNPNHNGYVPNNAFSGFQFLPTKLVPGDVLVTGKSSFNGDWTKMIKPQGINVYISWTEPDATKCMMERYGILTTLSTPPTYADCYRPPVFWNGASLTNRPIFYRHDMVNRPDNHLIPLSGKTIIGLDIAPSSEQIQVEIQQWNNFVNTKWNSSYMPYFSGTIYEAVGPMHDLHNDDVNDLGKSTYGGYSAKVMDKMAQAAFAGWVTKENRKKALDKITQFAIDSWGLINAGGIVSGNGGHQTCKNRPWNILLGWLYNRSDITNFHTNTQLLNRLSEGLTGSLSIANATKLMPLDYYYKALTCQDYLQRTKLFGSSVVDFQGFTGGKVTDPGLTLYHGLTSPSLHPSAKDRGWLYKISGISGSYGYTINNIRLGGQEVFGSFAVVVADRNYVSRLNALGPKSQKPLPAKLPPVTDSNNNLINRCFTTDADVEAYWGFLSSNFRGAKLRIVSGAGSGPTVYTIIEADNVFAERNEVARDDVEEDELAAYSGLATLRYANFTLDRDFQNGVIDNTSVFEIYPMEPTASSYSFSAGCWFDNLKSFGTTLFGGQLQPVYVTRAYNNISDETVMKHAALQDWLGITQDQFLIDYVKYQYFSNELTSTQKLQKVIGSAYVGEIFDKKNILGGLMVSSGLGLTGDQFFPTNITGLSGQSDNDPAFSLDGITLEFIPRQIDSYKVFGGSGITYTGFGATYTEPITPLRIYAIIDDKLFIDKAQPGLYNLMDSLKLKYGPFLSNRLIISEERSTDPASEFIDQVAMIDFGQARNQFALREVTKSTKYVKELPSFQEAAANSTIIKATFVSDRFAMAGAAGILPNFTETSKLVSTNGMASLKRTNTLNQNEVTLVLPIDTQVENNDLWYCISGVTIGSANTDMAEEYKYSNWVQVSEYAISGNELTFTIPNLHNGSLTPNYTSNTDDKLIFFRYLVNKEVTPQQYYPVNVPSPIGITVAPFNNTNYSGWNNNDIVKLYKINLIKTNNASNSNGYLTYQFNNSGSSNDYRRLAYNHFRVWHNNFYEYENAKGFDAFTTFIQNDLGQNEPYIYHLDRYNYDDLFTLNNVQYYLPKSDEIKVSIIESDVGANEQFYNKYIRGQTLVFHMPLVPQTLLWASGATS